MRIDVQVPAGEHNLFTLAAFDNIVGKEVQYGGDKTALVVAASVSLDGTYANLALDVPDGSVDLGSPRIGWGPYGGGSDGSER